MEQKDAFSGYHPAVNFLYFALVLFFTMFCMEPVCLLCSLGAALAYGLRLNGGKAFGRQLFYLLPMMLLAAVVNPLFNHQGETSLFRLPSGKPVTLESALFGLSAAVLLLAVISWFSCYNAVITSDKFVYLFGRAVPSLSLMLSMALRFIPRFTAQFREVRQARKGLGWDGSGGKLSRKMRDLAALLSIMVTWSLENAVDTGDSMKSRGYGLPGRTAFSVYRFDSRDKAVLLWLLTAGGFVLTGWAMGELRWQFFPVPEGAPLSPLGILLRVGWLALCCTPLLLDLMASLAWKKRGSIPEKKGG